MIVPVIVITALAFAAAGYALHKVLWALEGIERRLTHIHYQGARIMALGQDILDAVTAEGTRIDSIIALLTGLVANGTIDAETAQKIKDAIAGQTAALDAALAANVPPTPVEP